MSPKFSAETSFEERCLGENVPWTAAAANIASTVPDLSSPSFLRCLLARFVDLSTCSEEVSCLGENLFIVHFNRGDR